MSIPVAPVRYLLDQNFPQSVLRAVAAFMPPGITLEHVPAVDRRLSNAADRELIVWAKNNGYTALISTNHRMADEPRELAAMLGTRLPVVLTRSMGHNPLRATGVILLELPTLHDRIRPERPNLFMLGYEARRPRDPWDDLTRVAGYRGMSAADLYEEVRLTSDELKQDILSKP